MKRPGEELVSEATELEAAHHRRGDEADAYERLLSEAMEGDRILFARQDEVEAAWAVVEPTLHAHTPCRPYRPGTWGPEEAAALAAPIGGWHDPT